MTIIIPESKVASMLDMREVVEEVERVFVEHSRGNVHNFPRTRSYTDKSVLNVMHASLSYLKRSGAKCYISTKAGTSFVILLFDSESSELLAVIAADSIGRYRTGAASAVATKYLYGRKSFSFTLIGSGKQALTQITAMEVLFDLSKIKVWSPTKKNLLDFIDKAKQKGIELEPAESLQEACSEADVITTITSSKQPFISPENISRAYHVNACGSNIPNRAELKPECFSLFDVICVDSLEQSRMESGDLLLAYEMGLINWEDVRELSQIISSGKEKEGKTLFKSNGLAMEDIAVADLVYKKAIKEKNYLEVELFNP
jgi:alanine dehydrogenase